MKPQRDIAIFDALRRTPLFLGTDPILSGVWMVMVILQIFIVKNRYAFFFGVALLILGPAVLRKVVEKDPLRVQTLLKSVVWRHFYRARSSAYAHRITRRQEFRLQ